VKTNPSQNGRFADPWWRQFDVPAAGYRDSSGFVNRLPLRLESTELILWGSVDADKMWSEFEDEAYQPILVDGKAVVTVWINQFTDTDCGGGYLETWYNTFVTKKSEPQLKLELKAETGGLAIAAAQPTSQSFLIRVLCGDAPGNPGAAMKAITGGREMFGFPKHPVPAQLKHTYTEADGKLTELAFEAEHEGTKALDFKCQLPETVEGAITIPLAVDMSADDAQIGGPLHGGTHKGHNGALQSLYATSVNCTQTLAPWNPETDVFIVGPNEHFAPINRWDFVPMVKAHSTDFKICAHKPSGWISSEDTTKALKEHEEQLSKGVLGGAL